MENRQGIKIMPLLLIIFGILLRLSPHKVNFAPIGAIALFSGVYLPKRWNFIVPIIALLVTDYILKFYGSLMIFTYGSYVLITFLGQIFKKFNIVAPLIASVIFFTISNYGFWAVYGGNLISTYIAAIPFFKTTVLSDLLYTCGLFAGYEIIKYVVKVVKHDSVVVSWLV